MAAPWPTKNLRLLMPNDPVYAEAIRRWAKEKGINLIERRSDEARRYPYMCKNGHQVAGPECESVSKKEGRRTYRWCLWCRRATQARQKRRSQEKRKAAMA